VPLLCILEPVWNTGKKLCFHVCEIEHFLWNSHTIYISYKVNPHYMFYFKMQDIHVIFH
jgi:hypothetical protein